MVKGENPRVGAGSGQRGILLGGVAEGTQYSMRRLGSGPGLHACLRSIRVSCPGAPRLPDLFSCDPPHTREPRLLHQTFQSVSQSAPTKAPPCSLPRIEFHFPPALSTLPPPCPHLYTPAPSNGFVFNLQTGNFN